MSRRIPTAFEKWTSRLFAVAMLLGFVLGLFIAWKMMDGTPATTTAGDHAAVLNDTSPSQTGAITYHGVDIPGQGSVAVQHTVQPFELVQGVMARAQLVANNALVLDNGFLAAASQGLGADSLVTTSINTLESAYGTTDMAAIETMMHGGETAQVSIPEASSDCGIVCLSAVPDAGVNVPVSAPVYSLLAPSAKPANTALLAAAIFAALVTWTVAAVPFSPTRKVRMTERVPVPTLAGGIAFG